MLTDEIKRMLGYPVDTRPSSGGTNSAAQLENFEGTKYEWRAVEVDTGLWQGQWRSIPRHQDPSEWQSYGTLKNYRQDAEGSAYEFARHISRKM